jgi:hypothetical protein
VSVVVSPDPPNSEKIMGGSDWPAFNHLMLKGDGQCNEVSRAPPAKNAFRFARGNVSGGA